MVDIVAHVFANGVPQNGLTDTPEIQIRRTDTGAIEQAFTAMVDDGADGQHRFVFAIPATTRSYAFIVDADPLASVQVPAGDRYYTGAFDGKIDTLSELTQADILSDATPFPGANIDATISSRASSAEIAALNDLSIADVQTALTNQGYTAARALLLDNLDATISSRATPADITAALATLNDLSIADVQTALTNQGYTAARALLLDNLDAAISSRAAPGDLMGLTAGTLTAIQALILSDATPFAGADIAAILTATQDLASFIEGGREIDFVGDDVLGWQRIERNVAGSIIRRYDLFDETDTRINETVASFIGRQGMIARETIS